MQPPPAKGTSLWLMPEGEARTRLAALIDRLAVRLGTPSFAPHVTLLPGLPGPEKEVVARAASLARGIEPLTLSLGAIDGWNEPFRCLFVRADASAALRAAHARAARAFGLDPDPEFVPHLSLVYGTLAPDRKAGLLRELAAEAAAELEARHLHVWRTQGLVAEWRELAAFALGGGPGQGSPTATRPTSGGSDR
jgi:2'-5' RNA ligase